MVEIKKIAAISRASGGDINDVGQVCCATTPHLTPPLTSQVRQFINDLMRVLSPELGASQLQHAMGIFGTLMPTKHSQLYATIVDKAIQFHSAANAPRKPTAIAPPPAPMISGQQKSKTASGSSALAAILSTDMAQESRASKRAKMMQSTATATQAHSSSSSSAKALLSTVDGISLSRHPQPVSNSSTQQLKRLACIICKESPPREACASPCGHICCQQCWREWLRVKAECPMCRLRTTPSDIARIRVA
jgi:hypothetical protein